MPIPQQPSRFLSPDNDDDDDDDGDSSFAPSSLHPTSLIPEDYDDRYGFNSSAESEDSSGLLDHHPDEPRVLKKRKKSALVPLNWPRAYSDGLPRPCSPTQSICSNNKLSSDSEPAPSRPSTNYHHNNSSSTLTPAIPPNPHTGLLPTDSLDPTLCSEPEFFHSHHLRTSAHSRKSNNAFHSPSPTPRTHRPTTLPGSPESVSLPIDPPSTRRGWFSSRRQKRKHSFHALSATSSSSSASLSLEGSLPKKLDGGAKYAPGSRRSPSGRLRRWTRILPGLGAPTLLSVRWLRKALSPRQPLGIFAGLLLFIGFAVSLTTFLIKFLDTDSTPLPWRTFCQEQREFPHALADSLEPVNVFVGVFSVDSAYERRHLIRSTYARHSRPVNSQTGQPASNVQLRFVLGRPRLQHVRRVALEMETYNDIVVLDIQENMNRGKTYAFMRWASENATVPIFYHPLDEPRPKTGVNGIGGVLSGQTQGKVDVGVGFKKADFVVKADDDAFIVLSELERHLRVAPREKTYWGYLIRNLFMGGECYALSADLVSYVATSEKVSQYLTGAEDKKVAKWMRIHPNATMINWVTERCWVYDHPKAGTTYSHGFLFPDEVARVRAEGRRGLTPEEVEMRGTEHGQAFSTVTRWKERYVAPKSALTMEEEVEALVEGGGRYSGTGFRRPASADPPVPVDRLVFEPADSRLARSALLGASGASKRAPAPHEHTPSVTKHYEEPALKFGRPPSELMAHLPHVDNLPASTLKDTIQAGLEADGSLKTDGSHGAAEEAEHEEPVFVPPPTLRFDAEDLRVRAARFLGRAHGGTVVVHYLKRSEWFLETSLVLLGRAKTWDNGLVPGLYREAAHELSGVSSSSSSSSSSSASVGAGGRTGERDVEVKKMVEWGKGGKVEVVGGGGGLFGEPRRYGSAIIGSDGVIREGRVVAGLKKEEERGGLGKEEGEAKVDEIRKSQFGGAGWVRGKPRVRVVDEKDGPRLGNMGEEKSESTGGGGGSSGQGQQQGAGNWGAVGDSNRGEGPEIEVDNKNGGGDIRKVEGGESEQIGISDSGSEHTAGGYSGNDGVRDRDGDLPLSSSSPSPS